MFQIGDRRLLIAEVGNGSCFMAGHGSKAFQTRDPPATSDFSRIDDSECLLHIDKNKAGDVTVALRGLIASGRLPEHHF
jgi:hypothetical protein